MTDITSSFLQQVSACKRDESNGSGWNDKQKSRILKSPQKKLPFVATASEIVCMRVKRMDSIERWQRKIAEKGEKGEQGEQGEKGETVG